MKPTLDLGSRGPAVKDWQKIIGVTQDGVFGPVTKAETAAWQQSHKLVPDGVVGPMTWSRAAQSSEQKTPAWMPPRPNFQNLTLAQRNSVFGEFNWSPAENGNIHIMGRWVQENIVQIEIPQLAGVEGANSRGSMTCHRLAAEPFKRFFASVERAGLASRIISYAGCFVPRYVRGREGILSNHAHGTAFDINATWNWLGQEPAMLGERGCLIELVHIAQSQGLYWGGHFGRADGMHFELAQLDTM